jgi:hypothetical protein
VDDGGLAMKTVKCQNFSDAINKLQKYVDGIWHSRPGFTESDRRKWFKAVPEDSYSEEKYRVELWVLEGSPAKQIVIINHLMKEICCHDFTLRKEIRFVWEI